MMVHLPTFRIERNLLAQGYSALVGVDEAGCGALAGPLVAAAVILPLNSRLGILRDSKTLSWDQKNRLYDQIVSKSPGWAVGIASVEEIMTLGLRPANLLAMRRAVEQVVHADFALVDAWTIPGIAIPQQGIIHGDAEVKSIAAASVIAKVTRDRMMTQLADEFPQYAFEKHMGYGTKLHQERIALHGPCPIHRLTFKRFK